MTFNGFTPPVSNYFHMPNEWVNISAKINNLAELKVVEYVLRHTWGYNEYDGTPKPITVDEFMHGRKRADGTRMDDGTGLSKHSVIDGLKKAIEHGYLICKTDNTDRARIVKAYALKMFSSNLEVQHLHSQNRGEESAPQRCKIYTPEVQHLHHRGEESSQRSEKDTLERHLKKNTRERKNGTSSQTPKVANEQEATHSFIHPSSLQNKTSSQETKPEEVVLSETEQHVYDLACQRFFVSKPPEVTPTVKEHCGKIAKAGITTLEQMKQLEQISRQEQRLGNKPIYLGNLARGLNGWLQMQDAPIMLPTERKAGHVYSSYDDPDYVDDSFYPSKRKGAN